MSRALRAGDDAKGRLDVWLAAELEVARTEAQRLIESGSARVKGQKASKSMLVHPGMVVEVAAPEARESADTSAGFDIRYEDDDLAVINKPAGVVVHPGHGHTSGTLVEALASKMHLAPAAEGNRPGIVHRLDKMTSGLLVVAKTSRAYEGLLAAMKRREVSRRYIALVAGGPKMPTGRVEAPIGRSTRDRVRMAVVSSGKEATTDFEVIERFDDTTLLEATLRTGRTHQIRVHLSHIGFPVVGDRVYGRATQDLAERMGLERPFLHAHSLGFTHPITGEEVTVEEPLPKDLEDVLARLRTGSG